jgi:hypothetical protein
MAAVERIAVTPLAQEKGRSANKYTFREEVEVC